MKQLLLILGLSLGLATSVSANDKPFAVGDVFFCEMEVFSSWDLSERKLKNYKLDKFKFSIVDPNTVKFGEQGFFGEADMDIAYMAKMMPWLRAEDKYSKMNIKDGDFTFVMSTTTAANLIAATCDRF